ncbi:MAG: PD40 domain-containing protein [Colwellia sp.]|nr:PD40 domain-containing protein [Colwellia sp.]
MTIHKHYKFGDFTFDVSRKLLQLNDSNKTRKLTEKEGAVLCYFLERPQQVITRDELIESIWEGSYALETTINNIISTLRRELGCKAKSPKYINTIQNKGYEFVESVSFITLPLAEEKDSSKTKTVTSELSPISHSKYVIAGIALFLILVVGYFFDYLTTTNSKSKSNDSVIIAKLLPVTYEQGQEWSPSLSADGKFLAYVHRRAHDQAWQIKIKELATAEEILLTQGFANKFSPTWSKSGDKIFFIKTFSHSCQIWVADLSAGLSQVSLSPLVNCGVHSNMSPLAIGPHGQWLYYSEIDDSRTYAIKRINLLTESIEQITLPASDGVGDYSLALSPNGKYLAYLRSTMGLKTTLMLLDISRHENISLAKFSHRMYSLSWELDGSKLYFIDADNNLSSINVESKSIETFSILQNKALAPYIAPTGKRFVVDGDFYLSDIISAETSSLKKNKEILKEKSIVSSSYHDEFPTMSNDGSKLAFVSNRTGVKQIWQKVDNRFIQLSQFSKNQHISNVQFSPDGLSLVFLLNQIPHILDLVTHTISQPLSTFENSDTPIWSCDGKNILMTSLENGMWNLYQYNIKKKIIDKLQENITAIKSDCLTSLFYVSIPQKGVFSFNVSEGLIKNKVLAQTINNSGHWQVHNNYLYNFIEDHFIITHLVSGEITKSPTISNAIQSFYIINDQVYFSKRIFSNTSIKQLVSY